MIFLSSSVLFDVVFTLSFENTDFTFVNAETLHCLCNIHSTLDAMPILGQIMACRVCFYWPHDIRICITNGSL